MSNICAIPRCGRCISRQHLMCGTHWDLVPGVLRTRVIRGYINATNHNSRSDMAQVRRRIDDYRVIRAKAVNYVVKQLLANNLPRPAGG